MVRKCRKLICWYSKLKNLCVKTTACSLRPLLAAATQFLMTLTQPQTANMNSASGNKGTGQFYEVLLPAFLSVYLFHLQCRFSPSIGLPPILLPGAKA